MSHFKPKRTPKVTSRRRFSFCQMTSALRTCRLIQPSSRCTYPDIRRLCIDQRSRIKASTWIKAPSWPLTMAPETWGGASTSRLFLKLMAATCLVCIARSAMVTTTRGTAPRSRTLTWPKLRMNLSSTCWSRKRRTRSLASTGLTKRCVLPSFRKREIRFHRSCWKWWRITPISNGCQRCPRNSKTRSYRPSAHNVHQDPSNSYNSKPSINAATTPRSTKKKARSSHWMSNTWSKFSTRTATRGNEETSAPLSSGTVLLLTGPTIKTITRISFNSVRWWTWRGAWGPRTAVSAVV